MRIALLVLLALNLAAAVWLLSGSPPPEAPPAQADPGVPLLRLLGEQMDEAQGDSAEMAAAPEPPPVAEEPSIPGGFVCTELGPFTSQSALRQASAELADAGRIVANRTGIERRTRGHWVHLAPAESREQALAIARELSASGVRDYYVVTAGDSENTVSLGLFRDRANAERRQREIADLGYPALLSDRIEDQAVHWLTVAHPGPGPLQGPLTGLLAGDQTALPVDCPD